MATTTTHPLIVKTPGTCGGRPRIDGHRIRVQDVVGLYFIRGFSAEEIGKAFPSITLTQIHAALAYYHDNRDEIDKELQEDEHFVEEFIRKNPQSVRRWEEI